MKRSVDREQILQFQLERDEKFMRLVLFTSGRIWNIIIAIQSFCVTLLVVYILGFNTFKMWMMLFIASCDLSYLCDVSARIIFLVNPSIRKYWPPKRGLWGILMIDLVSLLPVAFAFYFYVCDFQKSELVWHILLMNRSLRIYRVFVLLNTYDLGLRQGGLSSLLIIIRMFCMTLLVGHILTAIWNNIRPNGPCEDSDLYCLFWLETNMFLSVLHYWSGYSGAFQTDPERFFILISTIIGFFLIYGHFIPHLLHVFTWISNEKAKYYFKYLRLQRYMSRTITSHSLKDSVVRYFSYFWTIVTSDEEVKKFISNLPLAMKKDIYTDIYWDAFRHSDIFQDVSRSCKRSLSLQMKTEYSQEGDIIFTLGRRKTKMIYLVQGILEMMAEENQSAPILSFSSGTVLGELSLFFALESHTTVRCRTLCELQTLTMKRASHVLQAYPCDKRIVHQKLNRRFAVAKSTQWRKHHFNLDNLSKKGPNAGEDSGREDNVKWLKAQWRAIWEAHERQLFVIKAVEEGFRIPTWHKKYDLYPRVDAASNYMRLLVLSDMFEEKKDVVCLKTEFPWAIDPEANFLKHWKLFIIIVALSAAIIYPFCTGWLDEFPDSAFTASIAITVVFNIDLALILMTAVKTKHGIRTKFSMIFLNQLRRPAFYLDVLAAIPFQIYIVLFAGRRVMPGRHIGLLLMVNLFKSHVFLRPWTIFTGHMVLLSVLKDLFIYLLMIYWYAFAFQIIFIKKVFPSINLTWHLNEEHGMFLDPFNYENFLSVFFSMASALSVPGYFVESGDHITLVIFTLCTFMFFMWILFYLGEFFTLYSIQVGNKLKYNLLKERIIKYLDMVDVTPFLERRIIHSIQFQWKYNEGDNLLYYTPVIDLVPIPLKHEILKDHVFRTLRKCALFESEKNEFLFELIDLGEIIAVPAGSLIVSYGRQCHRLYFLHKGYCQLNSFLAPDVSGGVAGAVLLSPGHIFPAMAGFVATLTPISVISLTDCEILTFTLENLLKTMVTYEIFQDIITVVRENHYFDCLSSHKPAIAKYNVKFHPPRSERQDFEKPFRKIGLIGKIMKRLSLKRKCMINEQDQERVHLRILRHVYYNYMILNMFLWPLSFGLLMYQSHVIIPILIVLKILSFIFMYFRFHEPYYDSKGLLITHPVYTMYHYITTTFIYDILTNMPIYETYRLFFRDPHQMDHFGMASVIGIQKMMHIIPVNAYITEQILQTNYYNSLTILKFLLYLMIFSNFLVNYEILFVTKWTFGGKFRVVGFTFKKDWENYRCYKAENNEVGRLYLVILHWMIIHLTTNDCLCFDNYWEEKFYSYFMHISGTILMILFFGWIASNSAVGETSATAYQERMKSFIRFLQYEKTDDKIVERAIEFFEHQWSRSHGQNVNEIFYHVPYYLHEDLSYPLYRPTLSKVKIFQGADDGFYRLLAMNLKLVHFNRGSVIFFRGQVQSEIYFIHTGKCFVFDWFLTLEIGSMIGDLNGSGVMVNKIFALTHVELLAIDSDLFYQTINVFYESERLYQFKVCRSENFIESSFRLTTTEIRPVDSRDVLNAFGLQAKEFGFEDQSYFEDPDNITSQYRRVTKKKVRRKWSFVIYPGSIAMHLFNLFHVLISILTLLIYPAFLFFGGLTSTAFILIGILDVLWLLVILATFRVGIEDKMKGDVITSSRVMAIHYVLKKDGFFLGLFAMIPLELIPIIVAGSVRSANAVAVSWLRANRLIRGYYLIKLLKKEVKKLTVSIVIRWISVIIYLMMYINTSVTLYLFVVTHPNVTQAMDPHSFKEPQLSALLIVYELMVDKFASSNIGAIKCTTVTQIIFCIIYCLLSVYVRALVIKTILSLLYMNRLARTKYKEEVTSLETYLKNHDLSPALLKEVLDYKLNILLTCRSENMPKFLVTSPMTLQLAIMSDLYLFRLTSSPLFQDINVNFLKLLSCRLKREFYFPSQKIVDKGDIDNSMYFIHKGEIYVVDQTHEETYVEFVIDRMFNGENFGAAQGLYQRRPHRYSYRARTVVVMLSLNQYDWQDLRTCYSDIYNQILERAKILKL